MTQMQLDREVAMVTGESLHTIGRLGFSIANQAEPRHDPEPGWISRHTYSHRRGYRRYQRPHFPNDTV
jgi:hypothetical protein